MTAARRRLIATDIREQFHSSQRRVSRALGLSRSGLRYAPVACDIQAALARRIEELAGTHPRFGYRRIWALLVHEGWPVNKKAVRRVGQPRGCLLLQSIPGPAWDAEPFGDIISGPVVASHRCRRRPGEVVVQHSSQRAVFG